MAHRKDPAAVVLGRKGGKATARKLTSEERTEAARKAAAARWAKAGMFLHPCPFDSTQAEVQTIAYEAWDGQTAHFVRCPKCDEFVVADLLLSDISKRTQWEEMRDVLAAAAAQWKRAYGHRLELRYEDELKGVFADRSWEKVGKGK